LVTAKLWKKKKEKEGGTGGGKKEGEEATDKQTKGDSGRVVKIHKTEGFTNIRKTPEVDDGAVGSWFGIRLGGNVLGKVEKNPVGTITSAKKGKDGYIWYGIKLNSPIEGVSEGYVRQDAVTF